MMGRGEPCGTFCSPTKCWVGQVPVDVPHEVEIQRQVQVPVPVTRQVPALFSAVSSVLVCSLPPREDGGA